MKDKRLCVVLPLLLLLAAVLLIVLGILQGEVQEVYFKAKLICLECIGVG